MTVVLCTLAGVVAGYVFRAQLGAEFEKIHAKLLAIETAIKAKL